MVKSLVRLFGNYLTCAKCLSFQAITGRRFAKSHFGYSELQILIKQSDRIGTGVRILS